MAEFVTVAKERNRMHDFLYDHGRGCKKCPLSSYQNGVCKDCASFFTENPEKAEKIIMDWAAEHPRVTLASKFFEIFSSAPKDDKGTPTICPHHIGWKDDAALCETRKCKECWNRPYIKEEE